MKTTQKQALRSVAKIFDARIANRLAYILLDELIPADVADAPPLGFEVWVREEQFDRAKAIMDATPLTEEELTYLTTGVLRKQPGLSGATPRSPSRSLSGTVAYTVTYASRRAEVWRWYWRAWARPKGLWRFHALFGLTFGIVFAALDDHGRFDWRYCLAASAIGFVTCLVFLPLWPQLRFNRSVRSLTITHGGIDTSVGAISGARPWKDVLSVEKRNSAVVITGKNRNAFIVPARAFSNDRERDEFYEAARRWHSEVI